MNALPMTRPLALVPCLWLAVAGLVHAQDPAPAATADTSRLDNLQREINEQTRRLDELRQALAQQEQNVEQLQQALNDERLETARGAGAAAVNVAPSVGQQAAPSVVQNLAQQDQAPRQPVGQAPAEASRPPEVAQIFDQPGVLTPRGQVHPRALAAVRLFVQRPRRAGGLHRHSRAADRPDRRAPGQDHVRHRRR